MAERDGAGHGSGPLARAPSAGLVLGAIASVQLGASLAHTMFADVGPAGAVFLRLLSAALVLLALWRPRVRGRSRHELALACSFGLVLAAMNFSFYESIDRIPLGIAVAIEFLGPLSVAVLGSRRRVDLVWVALALLGVLALTHGSVHHLDSFGVALALIAGVFWGMYIVLNARLGQAFEGSTGLTLALCVGAIVATPAGIAAGGTKLLEPSTLALGIAVGVLSTAIPYSFEVEALRRIAPPVFGVLMSLEPAIAALAGLIVLGQQLSPRAVAGIVLVMLASVGAARGSREAPIAV